MFRAPNRLSLSGKRLLCAAILSWPVVFAQPALPAQPAIAADAMPAAPKPPSVSVVKAETGTIAETILLTGTLVARDEILVNAEVEGLALVELLAEEGDKVQRGQVLARLSRDMLDAQLAQNTATISRAAAAIAQARNQIMEAEANAKQAEAAYVRAQTLKERGNASTETLEQREAVARVSRARVAASEDALRLAEADKVLAEAQRRELQVRLARTEIKAPASGIISRRTARIGSLVSVAGEPLFRIIGAGAIEVEADVPETSLARLRVGQPASVRPAGMTEPVPAKVRLVAPEVSRTSRLGRVRLAVDPGPVSGPVPGLAVGAFARGSVEVARSEGTLVPNSAVLYRPDGAVVQIVRDNTVETRPVVVGLKAEGKVEIRKGVVPGEEVVAVSGTFVRDGDRVTPVSSAASTVQAHSVQTSSTP